MDYRKKLEQTKANRNPRGYEKKALLEETDSDDDKIQSTLDLDEYEESKEIYQAKEGLKHRRQPSEQEREDFED